jgi:hypothetical protein
MIESTQDKQKEIAFFDGHAAADSSPIEATTADLTIVGGAGPCGKGAVRQRQ